MRAPELARMRPPVLHLFLMISPYAPYLLALTAVAAMTAWAAPGKPQKQFLNKGPKPPGYTHVVVSPPGKTVYISGQGGTDPQGKLPPDFATQAKYTFEHLSQCLKLAGAKWEDVVKINYFISDMANTGELRRIRAQYLNMENPPAATLVQVVLSPGLLLEVEAVAIIPDSK